MTYYFIYSADQIIEQNKILSRNNKVFVPGTVVVGGKRILFSQLSTSPTLSKRFVDAKIVASGNIEEFIYTEPTTRNIRG